VHDDQLPAVLGVEKVSLFPAADYDGTIQGLLGGTLDYAELGASGYAKVYLEDPEAVEPILTTVQTDGATGYYSVMLARKDSGINTIEDMKGKKLGFADPDSTSGFLVPSVPLPASHRHADRRLFGETGFGGGHENRSRSAQGQFRRRHHLVFGRWRVCKTATPRAT
jgi:phosphonate transport system substrate-binding protein